MPDMTMREVAGLEADLSWGDYDPAAWREHDDPDAEQDATDEELENDPDLPVAPDVLAILGFDPDQEEWDEEEATKARDRLCLSCHEFSVKYGPDLEIEWKHLPGQHDQSTHGHGGGVGSFAGVDTAKWPGHNSSAQWGKKKIALLEELAEKGDWDAVAAASYKPSPEAKSFNSYQKGVLKAQENLAKMKAEIAQHNPKNAEATPDNPGVLSGKGWTQVGGKLGTEKGGVFTGPDGQKYYVKTPDNPERVHNEVLAAKLYAAAGGNVVKAEIVEIEGKKSIATKWEEGSQKANFDDPAIKAEAAKDFAIHAWTGNWDCIGAGSENPMDNLRLASDGKLKAVDVGGALEFHGGGGSGKKPASAFGKEANEWDTLRDPHVNPSSAKVFKNMTPQQLVDSAAKLKSISDQDIHDICQKYGNGAASDKSAMAAKLIARRDHIVGRADELQKQIDAASAPKPAAPVAPKPITTPTGGTAQHAPAAPAIPPAPVITSAANAHMQKKFDAIAAAAKTGDIKAVEAIAPNATSQQTYTKKLHQYKLQVLASMQNGGAVAEAHEKVSSGAAQHKPPKKIAIDAADLPGKPEFDTKNQEHLKANNAAIAKIETLAKAGDLDALNNLPTTPSEKVNDYLAEVKASVAAQLNPPPPAKAMSSDLAKATEHIGRGITGEKRLACQRIGYWAVLGDAGGVPAAIPNGREVKHGTPKLWNQGEDAYQKMPPAQQQAVRSYTGTSYATMNSQLRNNKTTPKSASLLAAKALHEHGVELPAGMTLSRRYKIDNEQLSAHTAAMKSSIGKVMSDAGVVSTSTNHNCWGGNVHLKITLGPGVKGLPVQKFSKNPQENEVLLVPNTRMLVHKVDTGQYGETVVHMLALPHQESQCCPP